jgi:hypothetical protein
VDGNPRLSQNLWWKLTFRALLNHHHFDAIIEQ